MLTTASSRSWKSLRIGSSAACDGAAEEADLRTLGPEISVDRLETEALEYRQAAVAGRQVACELDRRRRLTGRVQHAHGDQVRFALQLRHRDRFEFVAKSGHRNRRIPDDAGVNAAELDVAGNIADRGLEDPVFRGLLFQLLPQRAVIGLDLLQQTLGRAADGCLVGICQGHLDVAGQQVADAGDLLLAVLADGDDGPLMGDRHRFRGQPAFLSFIRVPIVGGEVQIAGVKLVDFDLIEQRIRTAELDLDVDLVFLLVFLGDLLDGEAETGGAVHAQPGRRRRFPRAARPGHHRTAVAEQDHQPGEGRGGEQEENPEGIDTTEISPA